MPGIEPYSNHPSPFISPETTVVREQVGGGGNELKYLGLGVNNIGQ